MQRDATNSDLDGSEGSTGCSMPRLAQTVLEISIIRSNPLNSLMNLGRLYCSGVTGAGGSHELGGTSIRGNPPSGGVDVRREDQARIRLDLESFNEVRDGLCNELRLLISDNSGKY
jgi:hypothetical protein